jgi:hypothetical protein
MSAEHLILCGGTKLSSRQRIWRDAKTVDLRVGRDGGNVNLRISDLTEKLTANLADIELDLLEIATYVYCADQATCRGGNKRIDYGEAWYRNFRFEIPVRQPDFWSSNDVQGDLTRCLNDLSGDNFEFAFSPQATPPGRQEYFEFGQDPGANVEEVLLFSGGLDSFGGAVEEVLGRNRKVALVSHRANPKIDARQKRLVADLGAKVSQPRLAPVHVPVLVNKDKELNKEYTQRTRSFLYSSIAGIVARLFDLKRIRFYENGVTSLNLPISPQVTSTRATRSTHPKPLAGICSLLSRVFAGGFGIENHFLWKTKTDVLQAIKQSGHSHFCATTVSCAHTWEMTTARPHCGKCSQCVDRRLAALAAGFGEKEDPPDHYRFKLFTDNLDESLDRILVESYVEVINRIQRCDTPTKFCIEFPEVSRVINFVQGTADDVARGIYELYKRHAKQVGDALDAEGRANISRLRRSELPASCLLSIAFSGKRAIRDASLDKPAQPATKAAPSNGLVIDETTFSVSWQSGAPLKLGNRKEFRLLHELAKSVGRYVAFSELAERLGGDSMDKLTHVKSRLAKILRENGYEDLATKIKTEKEHYGLFLD